MTGQALLRKTAGTMKSIMGAMTFCAAAAPAFSAIRIRATRIWSDC